MMLLVKRMGSGPFGLMDPFRDLRWVHDEMDRLFVPFRRNDDGSSNAFGQWSPKIDLYEEKNNVIVKAELPGLRKEDISLTLKDDTLSITGERKEEHELKDDHYFVREGSVGRFQRVLTLPHEIKTKEVIAEFEQGILKITLPKSEVSKNQEVKIEVK